MTVPTASTFRHVSVSFTAREFEGEWYTKEFGPQTTRNGPRTWAGLLNLPFGPEQPGTRNELFRIAGDNQPYSYRALSAKLHNAGYREQRFERDVRWNERATAQQPQDSPVKASANSGKKPPPEQEKNGKKQRKNSPLAAAQQQAKKTLGNPTYRRKAREVTFQAVAPIGRDAEFIKKGSKKRPSSKK